jgi:hypothetical protein
MDGLTAAAPEYEVHAVRYGRHDRRRLSENFMPPLPEPVDLHDAPMPIDFYVWVLIGGGRTIVVDTGFDCSAAARRDRELVLPVEDGLKALGVQPDAVEDVVITHMHWDHAGNHDLFPRARYHVQDREMSFCTGRCMCHPFVRQPFAVEDVTAMVRRVYAGNVRFHDGTGEVAEGVTVHLAGGHSRGLPGRPRPDEARLRRSRLGREPLLREPGAAAALPHRGRRPGDARRVLARAVARVVRTALHPGS